MPEEMMDEMTSGQIVDALEAALASRGLRLGDTLISETHVSFFCPPEKTPAGFINRNDVRRSGNGKAFIEAAVLLFARRREIAAGKALP